MTREIWSYLTISDITRLRLSNKEDIGSLCIRMNRLISRNIKIRIVDIAEEKEKEKIRDIKNFFCNIKSLTFQRNTICKVDNPSIYFKVLSESSDLHRTLRELKITIPGIKFDDGILGLSYFVNITSLDLTSSSITNIGLREIGFLTNLVFLNLSCNYEITDDGLSALSFLTKVVSLNLSSCKKIQTTDTLSTVFPNLISLDMEACDNLSDIGIRNIRSLTNLKNLNLSYCDHILHLSFLSNMTCMTSLDLSGLSKIKDESLRHLQNLHHMVHLDLRSCSSIEGSGLSNLCNMSNLTFLNLSDCKMLSDIAMPHLIHLTKLSSLSLLSYNWIVMHAPWHVQPELPGISDHGMHNLSLLTNLSSLHLNGCRVTQSGLVHLSHLFNLTNLNLSDCKMTDEGLLQVSFIPKLMNLTFSWNPCLTCEGLKHLTCGLENLKHLHLRVNCYNKFPDIQLDTEVKNKLLKLESFSFNGRFLEIQEEINGLNHVKYLRENLLES